MTWLNIYNMWKVGRRKIIARSEFTGARESDHHWLDFHGKTDSRLLAYSESKQQPDIDSCGLCNGIVHWFVEEKQDKI